MFSLMSRSAGAGGEHSQTEAKLANGNTPYHKCHAQLMNEVGQEEGSCQLFGCLGVFKPLLAGVGTVFRL